MFENVLDKDFTVRQIAEFLAVSVSTITRRMRAFNITIQQQYSNIDDAHLDTRISCILSSNADLGWFFSVVYHFMYV